MILKVLGEVEKQYASIIQEYHQKVFDHLCEQSGPDLSAAKKAAKGK